MKDTFASTLASYLDALYPILYIHNPSHRSIDALLHDIAPGHTVEEYAEDPGSGEDLAAFLAEVQDLGYERPTIILLRNVQSHMDDRVTAQLRSVAERNLQDERYNASVIIESAETAAPAGLADIVTVFEVPLPSRSEIRDILVEFVEDLAVEADADLIDELASSFMGLSERDVRQLLNLMYQKDGTLSLDDRRMIHERKARMIENARDLEFVAASNTMNDVGGSGNLKSWLERKQRIFADQDRARAAGVDVPRAVLIAGVPGTGKGRIVRAAAQLFGAPLIRLNSRVLSESSADAEARMRDALRMVESVSQCVLWIDNIDQAFSIGRSNARWALDLLLTWLHEQQHGPVFFVATAADVSVLPPELLHTGRFDELFFLDLPNEFERYEIIDIHLRNRGCWNDHVDVPAVARVTEGYSGADLETLVQDAAETAFLGDQHTLVTADLLASAENVVSIAKRFPERLEDIRRAANAMFLVPANTGQRGRRVPITRAMRGRKLTANAGELTLAEVLGPDWWKVPRRRHKHADPLTSAVGSGGYGLQLLYNADKNKEEP